MNKSAQWTLVTKTLPQRNSKSSSKYWQRGYKLLCSFTSALIQKVDESWQAIILVHCWTVITHFNLLFQINTGSQFQTISARIDQRRYQGTYNRIYAHYWRGSLNFDLACECICAYYLVAKCFSANVCSQRKMPCALSEKNT